MKPRYSLTTIVVLTGVSVASTAFADYTPTDPDPGDTVTFSGPCDGFDTSVSYLTINVLEGATVDAETDGLRLRGNHYTVTNRGSISSGYGTVNPDGDDGMDIDGQDSEVINYGWIRGNDQYGANLGGSYAGVFRLYNYMTISGWEDGVVLTGTDGIIQNWGEIAGDTGIGVRSHVAGVIDNWGTISGGSIGALITGLGSTTTTNHEGATISTKSPWSWAGVYLEGANNTFDNKGLIDSDGHGIVFKSTNTTIANTGEIMAGNRGIYSYAEALNSTVVNSGSIKSDSFGVFFDSADTVFDNLGTVDSGTQGVRLGAANQMINNTGTIIGQTEGIFVESGVTNATIHNEVDGTITAPVAIMGNDEIQTVTHAGTMNGDVFLNGGNDKFSMRLDTATVNKSIIDGGSDTDKFTLITVGNNDFDFSMQTNFETLDIIGGGTVNATGPLVIDADLWVYLREATTLHAESEILGADAAGTFEQLTGTNTIDKDLILGSKNDPGVYYMRDGKLEAVRAVVGDNHYGQMDHHDGEVTVTELVIGNNDRGAYELLGGKLSAKTVAVGVNRRYGTMEQSDGIVETTDLVLGVNQDIRGDYHQKGGRNSSTYVVLGQNQGSDGRYTLSGKGVLESEEQVVGLDGVGKFEQAGGSNRLTGLFIGVGATGDGTYALIYGDLETENEEIGIANKGVFQHDAGLHFVTNDLALGISSSGNGTYQLRGGTLDTDTEQIGVRGYGHFEQTGGKNVIFNDLMLGVNPSGTGLYELSGDNRLRARNESIGVYGFGNFQQTGGSNRVEGTLRIPFWADGNGHYVLTDGEVTAFDVHVGSNTPGGTGTVGLGDFIQSGGTHEAFNVLTIHPNGTYDLSGGSLIAGNISNKGTFDYSRGSLRLGTTGNGLMKNEGTLNVSGGGVRTIQGHLDNKAGSRIKTTNTKLVVTGACTNKAVINNDPSDIYFTDLINGTTGYLVAEAGSNFFIRNTFVNDSTEAALWDTGQAHLGFIGGGSHDFHIAALDLGLDPLGYVDNFSWGSLEVADGGTLNLFGDPGEALYIDTLMLSADSTLNLNGVNLYYDTFVNAGGSYVGGDIFFLEHILPGSVIPAPSSLFLAGFGLLGAGLVRRKHGLSR